MIYVINVVITIDKYNICLINNYSYYNIAYIIYAYTYIILELYKEYVFISINYLRIFKKKIINRFECFRK